MEDGKMRGKKKKEKMLIYKNGLTKNSNPKKKTQNPRTDKSKE